MRHVLGVRSLLGLVSAGVLASLPHFAAAQGRVTVTPAPGVSGSALPTFEFVGEYRCEAAACPKPGDFGTGADLAAGLGNSFVVTTISQPNVRVWDLDAGKTWQFGVTNRPDTAGKILTMTGVMLFRDSVLIVGSNRLDRAAEKFALDGRYLGRAPVPPDPADTRTSASSYEASPSGTWALQRGRVSYGQFGGDGSAYVMTRVNVATGERETLDIPASLLAGYVGAISEGNLPAGAAAAIRDDGTIAVGFGDVGYRLMLIPVGAGPRVEGGRSIPKKPLSPEQIERIRNPPPVQPTQGMTPQTQRLMEEARARVGAREPIIPDGIEHFGSGAIQFDAKGRVWVNTSRGTYGQSSVLDVFSPTLEYLGEVTLEGSISYHYDFGRELLVTRMSGESGTYVKVWRIREP
jgi:hypothetical protein